jgi:membrane protease YdiL (CAAX protease family)
MHEPAVKPIPLWQSFLIFGVPGALIFFGVHYLVPLMTQAGVPLIFAWSACVLVPIMGNAVVIIAIYVKREKPDWATFVRRFRLQKLERKYWMLVPALFVLIVLLNESLAWTIPQLSELPGFAPAASAPEIFRDPYESLSSGTPTFMDVPLRAANWWLFPFWLIWVVAGVLGEELVWRGYVLPRQEATYGKWAWLVNGMLWNLPFHWYTISNCFSDMPFYLILPFCVQRIKNTWFAMIIHAMMISMAYVIMVAGMMQS